MPNYRLPEINKVLLVGRATKDSNLLFSIKNTPFCMITVANNRNYKDKNSGEWKRQTNFINVKITGILAERVCDQIKKGTPLYIEGSIETYKKEMDGKNITHTVIRASNVRLLSAIEEQQEEYLQPEITEELETDLPPIGEEDEELPF